MNRTKGLFKIFTTHTPNIWVNKSRTRWLGHVAHVKEKRDFVGKQYGRRPIGRLWHR
jgi:hypothetical protein